MATATIYAYGGGHVYGNNATYSTARNTSRGYSYDLFVGQQTGYYVRRPFIFFDTSSISSAATITSVKFGMSVEYDNSNTDFNVYVTEQNWADNGLGIYSTPYPRETFYDNALTTTPRFLWRSTSGLSVNTFYDGAAMTNNYVTKGGITKYSMISSRDLAGNTPSGNTPSGNEYIGIDDSLSNLNHRIRLTIEYTLPPSLPSIIWW